MAEAATLEKPPLAPLQRRIWLLHQVDPTSPVSNRPLARLLIGRLDTDALRRTLDAIAGRHQSLRTVFPSEDGEPWQKILPAAPTPFEIVDLESLPPSEREPEARRIASLEARAAFNLEHGPLFRVKLLRLEAERHVLLCLMHHLVFDGWSENVFLDELSVLYRAFARGQDSPLAEPALQYAAFSRREAERLRRDDIERKVEYWRTQLANVPSTLALPSEQDLQGHPPWSGTACTLTLPQGLTDGIRRFSRQERVSLFMTLLSAFQVLLARYSGQDDFGIGVPIAGRNCLEIERLIGCFVNILVFRARLEGEPTVRGLLARTRETALAAYANQDIPFERLVEKLGLKRFPDRWPLFQVMFQLRNVPAGDTSDPGDSRIEPFAFDSGVIAGVDLSLEVRETATALECRLLYRSGAFTREAIERMLGHYQNLLEAFVRQPDDRVWTLPMLSDAERHRLLVEWNDTRVECQADVCAHQFFERQAERTPEAIAVVSESGSLTYDELNRRANRLAHRLIGAGVGPERIVAVCMERSPGMAASILGVLKAGAAYLPLDPRHPRERLCSLIADARAPILIASEACAAALEGAAPHIITLDAGESERNPESAVSAENLAYVLYTSGSTGAPKGVMVSHRALSNHLLWRQDRLPLTGADRLLQRASYTFDDSVWEFLQPLMAGATLVQARHGTEADSSYLVDMIQRHQITMLSMVPSQLSLLLEEPAAAECRSLRRVTAAGEVLAPTVVERFYRLLDAELLNGYGPAEATIYVSCYTCRRGPQERLVPVGRPIANTEIYILDRHLQPVPIGVPGELCVGGAGLARGYLNRPELTAEKFIPHPFSDEPGARVYRTGDMARYRPDGNIEFLGRSDHQVKIRGQRIELGEVEAVLASHPAVRQAAVTLWEPTPEDKALAAYVIRHKDQQASRTDLRAFLGARLPDYMVPPDYVFLESMPSTASGKVDRKALPRPARQSGSGGDAPRNRVEAQLKAIWEEVLGLSGIGLHDSFFDLGGHSLAAVRVFSRIERRLGVRLPISALFGAPTLEQLARLIEQSGHESRWRALVPIRDGRNGPPLFCLHGNDGDVLFYRELASHLDDGRPVYGLQSPLLAESRPGLLSLEQFADLYLEEIRTLQPGGPYCLAGFCLGAYLAFEIACRLQSEGESVGLLAVIDTGGGWKMVDSWSGALRYHLSHMLRLSAKGRLRYTLERARFRAARLEDLAGRAAARVHAALGRPAPEWALRGSARAAHIRASEAYQPGVFHGNLVYFRSSEEPWRDYRPFWSRVVKGEITCIDVPGRGITTLKEPNVRVLAANLAACLDSPRGIGDDSH